MCRLCCEISSGISYETATHPSRQRDFSPASFRSLVVIGLSTDFNAANYTTNRCVCGNASRTFFNGLWAICNGYRLLGTNALKSLSLEVPTAFTE